MKNRFVVGILPLILTISLAGCGGKGGGENTDPVITGVMDQTVTANGEFDALAGVTASDKEDGDITSMIMIESSPELSFSNGKATPEKAGSYELVYSVTDKGGSTVEAYATLTVTKETGEAVLYKSFDFTKSQTIDSHGWEARIADGVSASGEKKQGAFVFDITNPGSGDGDIQLVKSGVALKAADYRVKIWAKSTVDTYAHILARDENAAEWSTFNGAYNLRIGQEITPLELFFSSSGEGSAELMLNLGKITPNPDNASDTTPENFTVTIDKIEIYEISGEEHQAPVYVNDFSSADEETITASAGDGASAEAAVQDGMVSVKIHSYPTDGGVWSIKADIALPDVTIAAGTKYYYSFNLTAENAQSAECLVESASLADQNRANFNGISVEAGETKTITAVFTAEADVSDPVIRLQLGSPSEGVAANTLTITDLSFGTMEGDLETVKTMDSFMPFGKDTANATNSDYPWMTFNGTDEDNERGVGTIWSENGSLFYRIDQGGSVDWHNKLVCGYNENPLTLAADSYYTVEITAKASKNVSCGFFLNPLGSWDPRLSENIEFTTEEQTFSFTTTDTFVMDMGFEMLFQFGSQATADVGEVTIEFSDIKIMQMSVQ